jgi:hypothetical protein
MKVRARFWFEVVLATLAGGFGLLTIFWRDWIEGLTGFDPDHHSGSVELLIVLSLLLVAAASSLLARAEWRRAGASTAAAG